MADSDNASVKIGAIEWRDLTVPNAEKVRDFYCDVVGWKHTAVSMGEYDDYSISLPDTGETFAGICHAQGVNENLPSQWLMYVRVENVAESARLCEELGGTVIDGPKAMGSDNFCVIRDPEGAVLALVSH